MSEHDLTRGHAIGEAFARERERFTNATHLLENVCDSLPVTIDDDADIIEAVRVLHEHAHTLEKLTPFGMARERLIVLGAELMNTADVGETDATERADAALSYLIDAWGALGFAGDYMELARSRWNAEVGPGRER